MITAKKQDLKGTIFLVAGSLIIAHLAFWSLPDVFQTWNAQVIDRLFMLRSASRHLRPKYDDTVVHVDLTDTSLKRLKRIYLNRGLHARLISNLSSMKVTAQLYDFIFAAPSDEKEDKALIEATGKAGNVYFGHAFKLSEKGETDLAPTETVKDPNYLQRGKWHLTCKGKPDNFYRGYPKLTTFPLLGRAARGLGFLNLVSDRDGVFRRIPLLVRYEDGFYPAFSFRAACDYLGVPPQKILVRPGKSIILKDVKRPGTGKTKDIVIPIDQHGCMLIDFIGPWERMKHYDFVDVLKAADDRTEMALWKEELAGKIVVVSEVTTGASDMGAVPTDRHFPLSGVHANTVHTILSASFFREISSGEMVLVEVLLMAVIFFFSYRLSSFGFSLATIGAGLGYVVGASACFMYGHLIFQVLRPVIAATFALIGILARRYVQEEKEKEVVRRTFESYFPPQVVKKIMANPDAVALAGQKKELTVLFSDIKDFTRYSATISARHVQELLSEYFEAMTEIVFRFGGTVDKFIGDGLMVFFGDPDPQPDHAERCVRAAIEMQKKAREIRRKWEERGDMPIRIRIGINTDEVVVGNMGSARRLSYTALGSGVNLAQRLESNAPVGGILISKRTYELVKNHVPIEPRGDMVVKGLDEPIEVYEVRMGRERGVST